MDGSFGQLMISRKSATVEDETAARNSSCVSDLDRTVWGVLMIVFKRAGSHFKFQVPEDIGGQRYTLKMVQSQM